MIPPSDVDTDPRTIPERLLENAYDKRAEIARPTSPARERHVPLRSVLKSLGLTAAPPEVGNALLERLRPHVEHLGAERLETLAAFAAQLARVAWIDDQFSAAERDAIAALLERQADLPATEARFVADLLGDEPQLLRSLEPTRLTRILNERTSSEEKERLIDCVYAVAAADRLISNDEDNEVRRIANALLISHSRLMEIRSRYRDRLEVLRLTRAERGDNAGTD